MVGPSCQAKVYVGLQAPVEPNPLCPRLRRFHKSPNPQNPGSRSTVRALLLYHMTSRFKDQCLCTNFLAICVSILGGVIAMRPTADGLQGSHPGQGRQDEPWVSGRRR